jgi:hypothetical protein
VETENRDAPWPVEIEGSSTAYRAPSAMTFPPTGSRRLGDSVLLTYGDGNGPREAGDAEAARAVFNGDGGGFQWCSGSGVPSNGNRVARGSYSGSRFGAGRHKSA